MPDYSILLIEYDASLREVLGDCLRELDGWNVTPSPSIEEGLRLCIENKPNVILVDSSTLEREAIILIEQLKQYSAGHAVPLILISTKADWFTVKEWRRMGFSGAINKPFNPATLSSQILRWIHSG